jgi:hypothetical protein
MRYRKVDLREKRFPNSVGDLDVNKFFLKNTVSTWDQMLPNESVKIDLH